MRDRLLIGPPSQPWRLESTRKMARSTKPRIGRHSSSIDSRATKFQIAAIYEGRRPELL
jgi:hypothetical protein